LSTYTGEHPKRVAEFINQLEQIRAVVGRATPATDRRDTEQIVKTA